MGRVRSGNTTATRLARRASSDRGGPANGRRNAASTAPASSPSGGSSVPVTTTAPSGTSTEIPSLP
jgi:hypothetical protein